MRAIGILLLCAALGGCDDDSTSGPGDLSAGGDDASVARDLSVTGDLLLCNGTFNGFNGVQTSTATFACPCGCVIDSMELPVVNPMWGASHSSKSSFAPVAGVGLGVALAWDGTNSFEYGSLYSVGPTAVFYLDGDFDMLLDYDLVSAPPGETHLVLSVRDPGTVQGLQIFEIERELRADGTSDYVTMLGGVPAASVATTATHGTLRMTRQGFTYKTYGDGQLVSTFIAQKATRVAVNVAATLNGCMFNDGGTASCGYQPRFHLLRLATGTLINMP